MMARKDGVGQIIKALVTVVTLVALTGGFRVIKTTLDDFFGLTRGADNTRIVKIFELAFPPEITPLPSSALGLVCCSRLNHTQHQEGRQSLRGR